jgi:hypothetical protein
MLPGGSEEYHDKPQESRFSVEHLKPVILSFSAAVTVNVYLAECDAMLSQC